MSAGAEDASVVVADDEPGDADIVGLLLRDAGYRVTVVYTGDTLLRAVAESRFDVALVNMMMPGPTGQQLYGALRALPHGAPLGLVFMTMVPEASVRSLVTGDYGYLGKPFTIETLLATVRAHPAAPRPASD